MSGFRWLFFVGIGLIPFVGVCAQSTKIGMHDTYTQLLAKAATIIPAPSAVESVDFSADLFIDRDEFFYLIGIKAGDTITSEDLSRALAYLFKKNKFSTITVSFKHGKLHFSLEGIWTFNKLRFEGIVLGKENYRQFYTHEVGQAFDYDKHQASMARIVEAFHAQGYFDGKVHDYLTYDKEKRTVTVHVVLEPNDCFKIEQVAVDFDTTIQDIQDEIQNNIKEFRKLFIPRLEQQFYSDELINKQTLFLKQFLGKRGFFNVKVQLQKNIDYDNKVVTLFFIIQFDQRKLFLFSGNKFFSNQDLFDELSLFGASGFMVPGSIIKEELERMYKKNGFWDAQITVDEGEDVYYVTIDEGVRMTVKDIAFVGMQHFKTDVAKKQFFGSVMNNYLDENKLQAAIDTLLGQYEQDGFWDTAIITKDVVLDEPGFCHIVITIDEGKCRYLGAVSVENFPALSYKIPYASMGRQVQKHFNKQILFEQKRWLTKYFHDDGYSYATIESDLQESGDRVDVVWRIKALGNKTVFGKTVLIGTTSIPFSYIMRELSFLDGQPWSMEKVESSIRNLQDLKMFETISLYPNGVPDSDFEKAIMLKLVEDDPLELKLRAGFQQVSKNLTFRSGTTYKLGGSVLYKNPMNVGDYVSADVDVTRFYRNLTFEYHRPWLFGKRVGVSFKGYSIKYIQPVTIGSKKPLYQASQRGVLIYFGRRYVYLTWGSNIGVELMETNDLSLDMAQAINFEPLLIDKKVPNFFLEPSIVLDLLDDKIDPTYGSFTVMSAKAMFPWQYRTTIFLKLIFEQSVFYPLHERVVGAARFRCGHIFQDRFASIMPPERFYLGGAFSLRGYEADSVPPLGKFIDDDGHVVYVQNGGKTMANLNLELRIKLFNLVSAVLFNDLGTLIEKSLYEIGGGKLYGATGFGFRYLTPIGPLRFDVGWKWKKRFPGDSRVAWFLTLGHAF